MSIIVATWTVLCSFGVSWMTFLLLFTLVICHGGFGHLVFSLLEAWGSTCAKDCDDLLNWILEFPSERFLIDSSASTVHAYFVFRVPEEPQVFPMLVPSDLARHSCYQEFPTFSARFFKFPWSLHPSGRWVKYFSTFLHSRASVFSTAHFCFSFCWAALDISFHICGHRWSGLDVACLFVNRSSRTVCIRLEVSHCIWWTVWNVNASDRSLPCNTSKVACVALATSKYHSGVRNDCSLGTWSLTLGSTWWQKKNLKSTRNHFALHLHPEMVLWWWRPVWFSSKMFLLSFPRSGWSRIKVDVLRVWSPPESFTFLRLGTQNVHHFWAWSLLWHWVFQRGFLMRSSFPTPQCLGPICLSLFQIPPAYKAYPKNIPGRTFLPNWWILDWSFVEIGSYSTIEPNGTTGPLKGFPKRLSYGVFPSDKRSWTFRR